MKGSFIPRWPWRKFFAITTALSIPLLALTIGLTWAAQASNSNETLSSNLLPGQETIKVGFYYQGDDLPGAVAAADDFANLLSQQTGYTVQAVVEICRGDVLDKLGTGEIDIAPISSFDYVLGTQKYGIQAKLATVRFGQPFFRSQFNVRSDSGYTSILDLQGATYTASDPDSTSGYMVPYLVISKTTGMTPAAFFSQVNFSGSHSQVIKDVYNGTVDVGSTFEDARDNVIGELPDVKSVVSILDFSENIPNGPWVVRSGLVPTVEQTLLNGITIVVASQGGQDALVTLGLQMEGVMPTDDSAYDIYRELAATFDITLEACRAVYLPVITNHSGG